jgi:hypothetical protein
MVTAGWWYIYTADCPTSPRLPGISGWIVDSYRLRCYIKPCELEDEALGTTFSFLQGTYTLSSEGCAVAFMAKNALSFSTLGKLEFYGMQHYLGFSQDRVRMRLAVLLGKLCEINVFSCPPSNVGLGLISIIPDLTLPGYPFTLVKKALATSWQDALVTRFGFPFYGKPPSLLTSLDSPILNFPYNPYRHPHHFSPHRPTNNFK